MRMLASLRKRPEIVLATIVCAVAGGVSYAFAQHGGRVVIVSLASLVVALALLTFVVLPGVAFRRRPSLRAPMTVDASDEGITVTTGGSSQTIAWADAKIETSGRICMIHHGDELVIVPLRAFRNAEREKAFFELVATRAGRADGSTPESPHPTPPHK